jgi:UDPglucose--hexose-1-phosphate uridylyltransferase
MASMLFTGCQTTLLHLGRYQAWRTASLIRVSEIRVDPLSGLRTIVAPERAERSEDPRDPFAEGNEELTPPEVFAIRPQATPPDTPGWLVRAFPNRFPALRPDTADPERDGRPDLFTAVAGAGAHEVIVSSPKPVTALAELDAGEVALAVDVWRERMRAHAGAAALHLFVNEGRGGGASRAHTHAQLLALEFVPALLARERERFGAYANRTMGQQLLDDLVSEEVRRGERVVAIDPDAVLLAPYAATAPYQLMIVPRRPRPRFEDDGPTGAALLHDGLRRLERRFGESPPLNLWIRTAPRGAEHFCWRIDIVPRLAAVAGLELGTGVHLNSVAPERAAQELRET